MLRPLLVHAVSRRSVSSTRGSLDLGPLQAPAGSAKSDSPHGVAHAAVCTFGDCDTDAPATDAKYLRKPLTAFADFRPLGHVYFSLLRSVNCINWASCPSFRQDNQLPTTTSTLPHTPAHALHGRQLRTQPCPASHLDRRAAATRGLTLPSLQVDFSAAQATQLAPRPVSLVAPTLARAHRAQGCLEALPQALGAEAFSVVQRPAHLLRASLEASLVVEELLLVRRPHRHSVDLEQQRQEMLPSQACLEALRPGQPQLRPRRLLHRSDLVELVRTLRCSCTTIY